jgi:hypothetical protein
MDSSIVLILVIVISFGKAFIVTAIITTAFANISWVEIRIT